MLLQPIDIFVRVWLIVAVFSAAYVAWDQFRGNPEPVVMKWGFVLVTLYIGPIGLLLTTMRYNRGMSPATRLTRLTTAAVLVLAVGVSPAVLDRCAALCAEHHDTVASAPSCHHATAPATRMGHAPTPCSHDHNGTVVTSAKSSAPVERSLNAVVAVVALPNPFSPAASECPVVAHAPPGSSLTLGGRSLPLRL